MTQLLSKWREAYERRFWYPCEEKLEWGARHPGDGKGRMVVWEVGKI